MGETGDAQAQATTSRSRTNELLNGIEQPAAEAGNQNLNDQVALLMGPPPAGRVDNILRSNGIILAKGQGPENKQPTALDNFLKENRVARLGLVAIEGTAYTLPGIGNAALHDLTHPIEAMEKGATAMTLGLAMRVALPKAGAARAIAAGVFTYFMVRDAAKPIGHAFTEAWDAENHAQVNLAAQTMGDGLGMFAWDAYWGMKIANMGERVGEVGLRTGLGERRHIQFENWKTNVTSSDKYFIGRNINRLTGAVDRMTGSLAERMAEVKPEREKLTFEQKAELAREAQEHHAATRELATMHKHGVKTTDGQQLGYSQSVDVFLAGKDPRRLSSAEVAEVTKSGGDKFVTRETESGLTVAERPGLVIVEGGQVKSLARTDGTKPSDATTTTDATGGAPTALSARVNAELNARNIAELARMAKQEMGRYTEENQQVIDLMEGSVGPVHAAVNPNHKALDSGYREWLNQMIALSNEVGGDVAKLQQIAPLMFRGRDAALGQLTSGLGPTGAAVHSNNLFSLEMHSNLRQGMQRAKIPQEALNSNNPPLNLIAFDGGAGPHTLPEINRVWDVDLVHWPRNMERLRMLRAGINGHENMHDQYGGILRFADSIRQNVIAETVGKALGAKATEMVDVPGHGQMSKKDLIVEILKAQANENTADMGGAAYTGPNGAMSLGVLLQALRQGGQLETRNVFGKELAGKDNPMGIEVHAMDAWRPKLVAEVIRQRANGDPLLLEYAKSLDKYAQEASRGGDDYVWASMDHPGQKISIPRAELDAIIPELVRAQFNTPLQAFKDANGKLRTFNEVVPDLPTQMAKMDQLADLMVDAIVTGKPLNQIPFSTSDYTMIQVQGAAMPAALRLVAKGMKPEEVNLQINRVSDHLELQFHEKGDPHISPLVPRVTPGQLVLNPSLALRQSGRGLKWLLENQPAARDWSSRNMNRFVGYGGMALGRDMFSSWSPGSQARALVEMGAGDQSQTSAGGQPTDGTGQVDVLPPPAAGQERRGDVPFNPPVQVEIPPGQNGPHGEPRNIPRQHEPFLSRRGRQNQVDINELLRLQQQGQEINNNGVRR